MILHCCIACSFVSFFIICLKLHFCLPLFLLAFTMLSHLCNELSALHLIWKHAFCSSSSLFCIIDDMYVLGIDWLWLLCWLMLRIVWLTLILLPYAACCEHVSIIRLTLASMLQVISWCCGKCWSVYSLWIFSAIFKFTNHFYSCACES